MQDTEIILTSGISTRWNFEATMPDAFGNEVAIPLNTHGLRLLFTAIGTPEDSDENAFIRKDNFLYFGISLDDAVNGRGYIDFSPDDTSGEIWPYFPCLLYWGFKAITPDRQEIPLGDGLMVVQQFTVKRTVY